MKRVGWSTQTKTPDREQRLEARAQAAIKNAASMRKTAVSGPVGSVLANPIPKAHPVRNEAYRRAVASLPCVICGVPGYSQAAHGSGVGTGASKGMGIKACDTKLFPACSDRPGVRGCHSQIDQGAMFTKAARHTLEPVWAADTQRRIVALGLWPENMPNQPLAHGISAQAAINTGAQE
jgi:hypothetical protein